MKKLMSLFVAALMSFSVSAQANHDGGEGHRCERHGQGTPLLSADVDHDGSIDWEEAHDAFIKHFDEMDTNQDGVLSVNEAKDCCMSGMRHKAGKDEEACRRHMGAHDKGSKEFGAADKDHDGTLTKAEAKKLKHVYKNFDAIDVDHDGTVDRDEVHNYMQEHPQGK